MNTDLISRQAAIDELNYELDAIDHVPKWVFDRLTRCIERLPSAQPDKDALEDAYAHGYTAAESEFRKRMEKPEPQWIPCSETEDLPEHEVLCCDKYGEELIGWLSYSDDQWICESDGEVMYDPIAWREKPEPYKGDIDV